MRVYFEECARANARKRAKEYFLFRGVGRVTMMMRERDENGRISRVFSAALVCF